MLGEIAPKLRTWFNLQGASSGQSLVADSTQPLGTKWVNKLTDPGSNGLLTRTGANTVSASSLTANAVLTGNTTGAPNATGVTIDASNTLYGYAGNINAQSSTSYTLSSTDSGKIVECNNASAITVTLPNSLAVGFCCTVVQTGAGQVTLSAASGATLHSRSSFTKTAGQWGVITLYVTTNSGGTSAVYAMGGDGA